MRSPLSFVKGGIKNNYDKVVVEHAPDNSRTPSPQLYNLVQIENTNMLIIIWSIKHGPQKWKCFRCETKTIAVQGAFNHRICEPVS